MMNSSSALESLSSADLLSATRELVHKSRGLEAELLLHLGEVDERKLYLECAFPSMFAFCVEELGFSEDAAYARITVARAARRLPAMVEAVRSGQVHLTGLRMLVPHLTDQNHREVLAQAAGKSKRGVEELVARLSPQPAIPALIRKLPELPAPATVRSAPLAAGELSPIAGPPPGAALAQRAVLAPLTEETFKVQFTASRAFRDKLRQAQDLLRHRVPDGDMAAVLERALDLLMEDVKKERFAVGRKVRQAPKEEVGSSRHIPDAIKASGLRSRRRALHVRGRARPPLRRDWSAGIRSRRRIRAHAPARCRRDPAPLPRAQPACGGPGLRTDLHGTSAGTAGKRAELVPRMGRR